jgi:hypothetical protein
MAFAGPGFDGVGDRGAMPGLEGPAGMQGALDGAQEEKVLEMVKEFDPEAYQRLLRLKDRDVRAYTKQLIQIARRSERLMKNPEARARFMEIRSLEVELRAMSATLEGQTEAEQQKTRTAMMELGRKLFDAKQADRRASIDDLNEKIAKIQEDIKVRDQERDARIEEYIDQLTRRKASGL